MDKLSCPRTIVSSCRCGAALNASLEPGFCPVCHASWKPRNHVEYDFGDHLGAITDRGILHAKNEDDVRISLLEWRGRPCSVLVVSDGISTAQACDAASATATQAALEFLTEQVNSGLVAPEQAVRYAIMTAHQAICAMKYERVENKDPPGATIVVAILSGHRATIGWVGDSRAYQMLSGRTKLLTHDHSWINDAVDSGRLTEKEAARSVNAHVITRCIGPVQLFAAGVEPEPSVVSLDLESGAWLLLCSDGLWNYAEQIEQMNQLIEDCPNPQLPLYVGRHLVSYATACGGRDNITVALARAHA